MKRKPWRVIGGILLAVAFMVGLLAAPAAQAAVPVTTQVAFCLDGSGSISAAEWSLMVNGLAAAVENPAKLPQDSTVELCIIQFAGSTASLEVPRTVIDSQATATNVANAIRAIGQRTGYTPTGEGIKMAKEQLTSPPLYPAARQIINLCTNGHPEPTEEVQKAIDERNAAIAAGIDEIDAEAIGVEQQWLEWLRDNIVYPQPGVIAPPYPDPPGSQGFVRVVTNFDEFAEAITEKFERIFLHLTLAPLSATNTVGASHQLTAKLVDDNNQPVPGETITFTVTAGPHAGTTGTAVTDANGEAKWSYTGTNPGDDTIVATGAGLTSNKAEKSWAGAPPAVPGMTEWGIIGTVAVLGGLMLVSLRRRTA